MIAFLLVLMVVSIVAAPFYLIGALMWRADRMYAARKPIEYPSLYGNKEDVRRAMEAYDEARLWPIFPVAAAKRARRRNKEVRQFLDGKQREYLVAELEELNQRMKRYAEAEKKVADNAARMGAAREHSMNHRNA